MSRKVNSIEKRKQEIIQKSHFIKGNNIKLGNGIWSFSKLAGNDYFEFEGLKVKGSCNGYCLGCKKACYVFKSYRYSSVIKSHLMNTLSMRYFKETLFNKLSKQIANARKKPIALRIHQSGELETKEEFKGWCMLAAKHPNETFYIYTKAYDIVIPALLNREVPSNLIVNISIWHKKGIKEYLLVKHLPNVKAFVYIDKKWNIEKYAKHGIIINSMCMAYMGGKLNHDITCDLCKKCFDNVNGHKCNGCNEH